MALWVVRAGSKGERETQALEEGVAAIGWDDLDNLSKYESRDALANALQGLYGVGKSKGTLGIWNGQIRTFTSGIKIGDLIALPLKSRSTIAFGEVAGPYEYRKKALPGMRHVRSIKWKSQEVPRSQIPEDLLFSFGSLLTVFQVKRNDAENRIRALLAGKKLEPIPALDAPEESDAPPDFEQFALDEIRAFIGQKYKGHELARIVGIFLEAQGYRQKVSRPGADGGVDIIAGHGPMGFDTPRLCVQVKSQNNPVDVKVIRELQGVMKNYGAERGLVVSWGGYTRAAIKEAERLYFEMRLWDADDLIQTLLSLYEKLPDTFQAEIPLKRVWTLVQEAGG